MRISATTFMRPPMGFYKEEQCTPHSTLLPGKEWQGVTTVAEDSCPEATPPNSKTQIKSFQTLRKTGFSSYLTSIKECTHYLF